MKEVSCSCGYVAFGETSEELLAEVEAHIDAVHARESEAASERVAESKGEGSEP
jgi:predicted small metal-binding protein